MVVGQGNLANMKKLISVLFLAVVVFEVKAQNLPLANAYYTTSFVNTFTNLSTNSIASTNYIGDDLYHTWYFNISTNVGVGNFEIDFSGDRTNWLVYGTVTTATGGTVTYTNHTGKQAYYRVKQIATNSVGNVTYLGGR